MSRNKREGKYAGWSGGKHYRVTAYLQHGSFQSCFASILHMRRVTEAMLNFMVPA